MPKPKSTEPQKTDPLVDVIRAYHDALRNAPDDKTYADAYAAVTYDPPMMLLSNWGEPARTEAGAVAALEMIIEEAKDWSGSPIIGAMAKAALGYLKAAGSDA